jgi:Fic family protein
MTVRYELPERWVRFDANAVFQPLVGAKAALAALNELPFQRSWAEELQQIQLEREVAGTSRIEGAEFTERELDAALQATPGELETRSQRQAAAAVATYRWIARLPRDRPIDADLIREAHRRLVTGCDDDHRPPGQLRTRDQNVTFGSPRHRGVEGGEPCEQAFARLIEALHTAFRSHDPIVQALALHYHFAAMHPFLDGNGRTARALEALMLQRLGLRDSLFIAMSNYCYEEKSAYLQALNDVRAAGHDLTPFLVFALRGVEVQCRRLLVEIREHLKRALFRNRMHELFGRLRSPRKRVMSARHVQLLNLLLDEGEITLFALQERAAPFYSVANPRKALIRDLVYLINLAAIHFEPGPSANQTKLRIDLDWPTRITETEFFAWAKSMPKGKVYGFLSS